jgi:glycosyltransferase involved in cell wall biosynthesis
MRFAIETTTTRGPLTGIGHYVHRLGEAILPLLGPDDELIGFNGLSCQTIDLASIRAAEMQNTLMSDGGRSGIGRAKYQAYLSLRSSAPIRLGLRYLKKKAFQASERKFDVFHAVQMIPPGPSRKPVLPVIHDLSYIRFPNAHPLERVRWLQKRIKLLLDEVPFIQTVSQFSKQEIMDVFGVQQERIRVSYPGIAPAMLSAPSCEDQSAVLAKYCVKPGQYFLVVATREPRKNVRTITEAYASLPEHIKRAFPLLWIGHRGWGDLGLAPAVERAIEQGDIRLPGYVPDGHVAVLYRHTRLFMISSVYEGFGMPVTEALACGASVAISDIPVFREVAGGYASYIGALDIDGWRAAMVQAADTGSKRPNPEGVATWLARYSWSGNAAQSLELYRRLARRDY